MTNRLPWRFRKSRKVDENYLKLTRLLIDEGNFPGAGPRTIPR